MLNYHITCHSPSCQTFKSLFYSTDKVDLLNNPNVSPHISLQTGVAPLSTTHLADDVCGCRVLPEETYMYFNMIRLAL